VSVADAEALRAERAVSGDALFDLLREGGCGRAHRGLRLVGGIGESCCSRVERALRSVLDVLDALEQVAVAESRRWRRKLACQPACEVELLAEAHASVHTWRCRNRGSGLGKDAKVSTATHLHRQNAGRSIFFGAENSESAGHEYGEGSDYGERSERDSQEQQLLRHGGGLEEWFLLLDRVRVPGL
jgi:hypothetical protein